MKDKILLKFKPSFQKELFKRVILKYGNSFKASPYLGLCPSVIRSYKCGGFQSVSEEIVGTLIHLNITDKQEVQENIIKKICKTELINLNLTKGRDYRGKKLSLLKNKLPNISTLIKKIII